jgi:hypothetical protein
MKRYLILLFIFSNCLYAQTVITADKAAKLATNLTDQEKQKLREAYVAEEQSSQERTAARMLMMDLAPFVLKTDRDVTTYNYRTKSEVGLKPDEYQNHDSDQVLKSSLEWASAVKKQLSYQTGMFGWGLYTARDSITSEEYGEAPDRFVLTTLNYPKGSRMLDLRVSQANAPYEVSIPVSKTTSNFLKKICGNVFYPETSQIIDGQLYDYYGKRKFSVDPKCQNILNAAFDELNISGVIYTWDNDGASFDFCTNEKKDSKDVAFVAVNVPITKTSTEFIMKPSSYKVDASSSKVYRKLALMKSHKKKNRIYGSLDYDFKLSGSKSSPATDKALLSELQEETFGCDSKHAEADKPHYDPNQVYEVLAKDVLHHLDKKVELKVRDCLSSK